MQSLLDICEGLERYHWARVGMRWWEQEEIDLPGLREVAAVVVEEEGEED